MVQEVKPNDLPQRRTFAERAPERFPKIRFFIEKLPSATKLIFGQRISKKF